MRFLLPFLFILSFSGISYAQDTVKLYRLDCGMVKVLNLGIFSIDDDYEGQTKQFVSSCYIIKHGNNTLLWDAGLPEALIAAPENGKTSDYFELSVQKTLSEQLDLINLTPEDITHVAVSHGHGDHSSNLRLFTHATLYIQSSEFNLMKNEPEKAKDVHLEPGNFSYFLERPEQTQIIEGDFDLFGDGLVQFISLPGHTIGHMGLMLDLQNAGKVILSGDQWHFSENRINDGVPSFNYDVKDGEGGEQTRASSAKLEQLVEDYDALLIIQHEPKHIYRLPKFPAYLD